MKADDQQGLTVDTQGYYLTPIDLFIKASFREFNQWFTANYPQVRLKIKNKDTFDLVFVNSMAFTGEISIKPEPENSGIRILGIVRTRTNSNWGVIFSQQCARYFEPKPPQKKKSRADEIIEELPDGDKQLATTIRDRFMCGDNYTSIAERVHVSRSTVYRWLVKLELIKSKKKDS